MSTLFDPKLKAREAGAMVIDNPIINPPFTEPQLHWDTINWETHEQKVPTTAVGRRPAGYFFNPKGTKGTASLAEEQFVEIPAVNEIRMRVQDWRRQGYPGVTQVTRRLLEHWTDEDRERKLFFCQLEAAETIIWLTESHPTDRQGIYTETVDGERALIEAAHEAFVRYCCKMATGTGKTVVMAMLIAWVVLNKHQFPQDKRFSPAILIVAPGLTVKERLKVLLPTHERDYYSQFDLVPVGMRSGLSEAKICIVHRQELAVKDDTSTRSVVKLGMESDSAFANRLLKRRLGSASNLLVINDEGHHCYRPRQKSVEEKDDAPSAEEKKENERAAQWQGGLERISRARGISMCLDFSATPFYIHGSGYPAGRPFPWIVSDFGLLDAIESGLVKIPQMPVDDNHGDGKSPPAYFHLWRWINERLPSKEKQRGGQRAKPESVAREAEPATVTMIGNWKKTYDEWMRQGSQVPPCMIIVSQDTAVSKLMFEQVTREDFEFDHFVNKPEREVSFLYDSRSLEQADEGETVQDAVKRKREVMNSVGKEGEPGQDVRFISSVSMLTEGWDANNVTQIIGLRAFTSQLLCEQVVGRALRRRSYSVDPDTGLLQPEYADIYGVPFQVIPVRATGKSGSSKVPPPSQHVVALRERRAEFEIRFPNVEGYVPGSGPNIVCDWEAVPYLEIGKNGEPTEVKVAAVGGYFINRPQPLPGARIEKHNRIPYYQTVRLQSVYYKIAADIVNKILEDKSEVAKCLGFKQVLAVVRKYSEERIRFAEVPKEEIGLLKWQEAIQNAVLPHIHPANDDGEPVFLPRIERFRPEGTSAHVNFSTGRPCIPTVKSHVSHVVLDAKHWENIATQALEDCEQVQAYVRNDHLDFLIPYLDPHGVARSHRPDFIERLQSGLHIALEIKGYEREEDERKKAGGIKWAKAVNRYYGERRWVYHVCYAPERLSSEISEIDRA